MINVLVFPRQQCLFCAVIIVFVKRAFNVPGVVEGVERSVYLPVELRREDQVSVYQTQNCARHRTVDKAVHDSTL